MGNFLLFFNISGGELFVIVLVVYLVFGPKKIPELARMLGKGINELRRATNDVRNEINREVSRMKTETNLNMDDPGETVRKRTKTAKVDTAVTDQPQEKASTDEGLK